MTTETEMGAMQPDADKCGQPPEEAQRGNEWTLSQSLQREHGPANTWISGTWPPGLWQSKFLLLFSTTQVAVIVYISPSKQIHEALPNK